MSKYYALLACGTLALAVCNAGTPGYLPAVGPTPLRFSQPPTSAPLAALPPLLMKTPLPQEQDVASDSRASNASSGLAAGLSPTGTPPDPAEALQPEVYGAASLTPIVNPYADGVVPEPEGGWWRILVTNPQGFLSVPARSVGFVPPAVSAPPSRATYNVTP